MAVARCTLTEDPALGPKRHNFEPVYQDWFPTHPHGAMMIINPLQPTGPPFRFSEGNERDRSVAVGEIRVNGVAPAPKLGKQWLIAQAMTHKTGRRIRGSRKRDRDR